MGLHLDKLKISDRSQEIHVFKTISKKSIIFSNTNNKPVTTTQLRLTTGFHREGDQTLILVQRIIHQALAAITTLSVMSNSISLLENKKSRKKKLRAKSNITSPSIKLFKTKKCLQVPCQLGKSNTTKRLLLHNVFMINQE